MALHYLNQKYQPGLVFQQLEKINYKMVVGIDVGHGECMAYVYRKDNTGVWRPEPLSVTPNHEKKIPSYIAYNAMGEPIIGKAASEVSSAFYVYFKQEPANWEKKPEENAPTYKQLMQDYIKVLWNNIWIYNDIFHNGIDVKKEDVLVVIGCPASGSWTKPEAMRQYVELTRDATECQKVMILAESTAAIMTPIYSKTAVNLQKGVAIYDFGSSTLDFTYILMGKVLLTASIPLGGSDVDKAMLRYVLNENGTDEESIDRQSKNACYTELRALKEHYYETNQTDLKEKKLDINRRLNYWLDDEVLKNLLTKLEISFEGKDLKRIFDGMDDEPVNQIMLDLILGGHQLTGLQLSQKKRKEIYQALSVARNEYLEHYVSGQYSISVGESIPYTVDRTMMEHVIQKDTEVSVNKLERAYKNKSWKACVEQFFDDTKNSIGTNPCGTVILTGGTSKITDVRQIAQTKYGASVTIHAEPDPSITVAKGLCLAKGHEVSAAEKMEELKKELEEKTKGYFSAFCEGFGKGTLFDCVWARLILSFNELKCEMEDMEKRGASGITTYRELKKALETKLSNDVNLQAAVKRKFTDYVEAYMDPEKWTNPKKPHCTKLAKEKANQLASEIYGTQATTVPQVSVEMIDLLAGGIDDTVLLRVVKETSLARAAQKIVVDHMYTDQKVLGGLKRMVKKASLNLKYNSHITQEDVTNMYNTLEQANKEKSNKEKYRRDLGYQFGWGLQHSDAFRGIFENLIDQQFEVAVGIILFQVFDN